MNAMKKETHELRLGDQLCYWPSEVLNATPAFKTQRPVQMSGTITFIYPTSDGIMVKLAFDRFLFIRYGHNRQVLPPEDDCMVSHRGTAERFNGNRRS